MPAFKVEDLSVLAYGNGFTLWHYKTADTLANIKTNDYFNPAADMLRTGDIILSNTSTGTTFVGGMLLIQSISSGTVTVADLLA